jgi:hypothetical protein
VADRNFRPARAPNLPATSDIGCNVAGFAKSGSLGAHPRTTSVYEHRGFGTRPSDLEDVEEGCQRGFHESRGLNVRPFLRYRQHAPRVHRHLSGGSEKACFGNPVIHMRGTGRTPRPPPPVRGEQESLLWHPVIHMGGTGRTPRPPPPVPGERKSLFWQPCNSDGTWHCPFDLWSRRYNLAPVGWCDAVK